MTSMLARCLVASSLLTLVACVADPTPIPPDAEEELGATSSAVRACRDFQLALAACTEMASLAPVPVANVRSLVPSAYRLAGEASGTATLVVRIAQCASNVLDGRENGPGIIAQVGVNVVSPDGTGDINNYSLWYYTDSQRLAKRLERSGVDVQYVPRLRYRVESTASGARLFIDVPKPGNPAFRVAGPVVPPTAPPVPFSANWWDRSPVSDVKLNTVLDEIRFSSASLTLTTSPASPLGRVIGGGQTTFPFFDSYNTFDRGRLVVSATR